MKSYNSYWMKWTHVNNDLEDGLPISKVVWYGGPQKKNKHLENSLPMSKIVGDSNCKRSATRPRQLHPHGEDHLPLAWWEKTLQRCPCLLSTIIQTNKTCAKFCHPDKGNCEVCNSGDADKPSEKSMMLNSYDNHENNCQSQEKDTEKKEDTYHQRKIKAA